MNEHKLAKLTPTGRLGMVQRLEAGAPIAVVAAEIGLSTTAVRRWWQRYRAEGPTGLENRSSRPRRSPGALPRYRRRQIARLRQRRWSSVEIARHLRLALSTVVHVQRALGLARLGPAVPRPPVVRYERRVPGALIHLDIKKLGRIGRVGHRIHGDRRERVRGIGREYLHVAIDDAARLAHAALFSDETAVSTAAFLSQAVAWFRAQGVEPRALLTDNGGGYRSHRFQGLRRQLRLRNTGPGPTAPRPTGRRNASSGPPWPAGPIGLPIGPRSSGHKPCPSGCGTTIRSGATRPSDSGRRLSAWQRSSEQPLHQLHLDR